MSLSKPIDTWPTLLCGPVVRRVTTRSVSVFVATRHARHVSLTLFKRGDDGQALNPAGASTAPVPTIRLGQRLHVAVVTAQGLNLLPGKAYCYDVTFHKVPPADGDDRDNDAAVLSLAKINGGMLSDQDGTLPLGYAVNLLPSFLTPPLGSGDLHFFHGSCRKIHGGGRDALPLLDADLSATHLKPAARPQMLFLTGDQIYADDVAGPLLPLLSELAGLLLGWNEKVPTPAGAKALAELQPGSRSRLILRSDMTSEEGHCHLLGLGEFYAMYLLAWSPALWPDAWPAIEEVMPKEVFLEKLPKGLDKERKEHLEAMRKYRRKHAKWDETINVLREFKEQLGQVRRLLANIPSYMMFDDHEVTDDWYLHAGWQVDVLSKPLGQRVIGNALSGYAVFQAWGNDPLGEFRAGADGEGLLNRLVEVGAIKSGSGETYQAGLKAHDVVRQLLRVTPESGGAGVLWDYGLEVDDADWRAIVLDTRTHRNLTRDGQVDLIDIPDMKRQLTERTAPARNVTIVVSPAPVIGHPVVEKVFGQVVRLFPRLRTTVDNETWANAEAPAAFEKLLELMSHCGRAIILSGDVHYGFSTAISYWNDRSQPHRRASLLQLCSSALKNEDFKTITIGSVGTRAFEESLDSEDNPIGKILLATNTVLGKHQATRVRKAVVELARSFLPPPSIDVVGWNMVPNFPRQTAASYLRPPQVVPAILEVPTNRAPLALPPPEWRYRLQFIADLVLDPSQPAAQGIETDLARSQRLANELRTAHPSMPHRIVVGETNIGRVQVAHGKSGWLVLHDLHRPGRESLAHTRHLMAFDPPDDSIAPPGFEVQSQPYVPDLSLWLELASFRPPAQASGGLHQLEQAFGPLYLDVYGVHVTQPPTSIPGDPPGISRVVTLEELMRAIRQQMLIPGALFIAPHGGFSCPDVAQAARWCGQPAEAEGVTLMAQQQRTPLTPDQPVAYRSVLVTPTSWILSSKPWLDTDSVFSKRGFYGMAVPSQPHWFVFTLGAHREATRFGMTDAAWDENHRRWSAFAPQLVQWIGAHGGMAEQIGCAQHSVTWPQAVAASRDWHARWAEGAGQ